MKLHLNSTSGLQAFTGHGKGFVMVNGARVDSALILLPDQLIAPWTTGAATQGVSANCPTVSEFAMLHDLRPEMVLFGSGSSFRFPHPSIAADFSARGIGFDAMDTPAACRTFNVLAGEGRRVAAMILVP